MAALRERNPTTTAVPARVRMFQATIRPQRLNKATIETEHGRLIVSGRLGQRHADLYEGILRHAKPHRNPQTKEIEAHVIDVDASQLRRVLSDRYSHQQMWQLATELREAVVEIYTPRVQALGGIINDIARYRVDGEILTGALAGECRVRWTIQLGRVVQEFLDKDIRRYYDPGLVARLSTGIGQAVARWLLTHHRQRQPTGGWYIDTVIEAVCGAQADATLRKRRCAGTPMVSRDLASRSSRIEST